MTTLSYGIGFLILNDVYQPLPTPHRTPLGKQYQHLASVARGTHEYVAYLDPDAHTVYIEEVSKISGALHKIEDDNLWKDLKDFLFNAKLLEVGQRKEVPVSKDKALELGLLLKAKPKEI